MQNVLWYGSLAIQTSNRYDDRNAFPSNWIAAIRRLGRRLQKKKTGDWITDWAGMVMSVPKSNDNLSDSSIPIVKSLVGPPYVQSGALYALGFLNTNDDEKTKGFIIDILKESEIEVVWHGACLGLGLLVLESADDDTYDEILGVVSFVSVGGDGTGVADLRLATSISIGLVNTRILSERTYEMVARTRETQHEKRITYVLSLKISAFTNLRLMPATNPELATPIPSPPTLTQKATSNISSYVSSFALPSGTKPKPRQVPCQTTCTKQDRGEREGTAAKLERRCVWFANGTKGREGQEISGRREVKEGQTAGGAAPPNLINDGR
ncbi:unnamed protein product [Lactuca saligna]|uniref:Uncharacterized protein n=1 Tax=Lactuca saligna TaxID=75948 RepID=A0AA36DXU3_LACSI|nr:unnamed protein product [Lactuca saligna]